MLSESPFCSRSPQETSGCVKIHFPAFEGQMDSRPVKPPRNGVLRGKVGKAARHFIWGWPRYATRMRTAKENVRYLAIGICERNF